ncbi:MAG: transporter substrate-binding domain-containing protein, partial [Acetobacteraceae bacterium]
MKLPRKPIRSAALAAVLALALAPCLTADPALAAPANTVQAQPAYSLLDVIRARGELRVGLTGDYKPFSFLDHANGTFTGLDVDMAGALAKAMGVKLAIVHTTWPTMMADLMAGKFDLAMGGVTITLARLEKAYF